MSSRAAIPGAWSLAVVLLTMVVGCADATESAEGGGNPSVASSASSPEPEKRLDGVPSRTCESSIYGPLPDQWRGPTSLVAGPFTIGGIREFGPKLDERTLQPVRERSYSAIKTLTTVEAGRSVILAIAPRSQATARLLFTVTEPSVDGAYRLAEGTLAVRLTACTADSQRYNGNVQERTQFNGAIIATGPQCLHLRVMTTTPVRSYERMVRIGRRAVCQTEVNER